MRKLLILGMLVLSVLGSAFAQGGQGGFPGMTDEMRKKMQAYQPVFDLTRTVGILQEVDQQKGLGISKAQAQKLLPVLKDLQTRTDLKPADAEKILANIEDNILNDAQLAWIDKTQLARQEEARKRFQQRQNGQQGQGQNGQAFGQGGQQGQGGQGQRQGGPGGRGGFFQAISEGKPFNPFKEQPRSADNLKSLIALLQKK